MNINSVFNHGCNGLVVRETPLEVLEVLKAVEPHSLSVPDRCEHRKQAQTNLYIGSVVIN